MIIYYRTERTMISRARKLLISSFNFCESGFFDGDHIIWGKKIRSN